jgi:hypothetical protein
VVPDALSGGPHFAAYCERYIRHTKGRWAGRPVVYEDWQREFWWEALEFDPATVSASTTRSGSASRARTRSRRWPARQPAARDLAGLQAQLDTFRPLYNEGRPHRAIGRRTPAAAYAARPKAHPAGRGAPGHFRLRYDVTDGKGAITLRRGGRMHHLKVGASHARRRVLAIVDEQEVTVVALDTGELLSVHRIEPSKGYWRNQRRDPGRWPGSEETG